MITFDEDDATVDARTAEDHRRLSLCDAIECLVADIRDEHPGLRIHDLSQHLPEPQRTCLLALLDEASEWIPFPVETP